MFLYILNLFDLCCTLHAVSRWARELNPLMRNIPFMVFYKVVILGGLLRWLSQRREQAAIWGIKICTAVYAALAVWHCVGIIMAT